jgi:hypothetical protein
MEVIQERIRFGPDLLSRSDCWFPQADADFHRNFRRP